jgi:hypothetical protein
LIGSYSITRLGRNLCEENGDNFSSIIEIVERPIETIASTHSVINRDLRGVPRASKENIGFDFRETATFAPKAVRLI